MYDFNQERMLTLTHNAPIISSSETEHDARTMILSVLHHHGKRDSLMFWYLGFNKTFRALLHDEGLRNLFGLRFQQFFHCHNIKRLGVFEFTQAYKLLLFIVTQFTKKLITRDGRKKKISTKLRGMSMYLYAQQ